MKAAIKNLFSVIYVLAFVAVYVAGTCWLVLTIITYGQKDVASMDLVKLGLGLTTILSILVLAAEWLFTGPIKVRYDAWKTKAGVVKPAKLAWLSIAIRKAADHSLQDIRCTRVRVKVPDNTLLSMKGRSVVDLEFDQIGQVRKLMLSLFFIDGYLESWNVYYDSDYPMTWIVNDVVAELELPVIAKVKSRAGDN